MLGDQLEKTLVEGEQEREQLHEELKKKEEDIAYLRKNATSSCLSPEESYWFNDDDLSECDEVDCLEG